MQPSITTIQLIHPHPIERTAVAEWLEKRPCCKLEGQHSHLDDLVPTDGTELVIVFAYTHTDLASTVTRLRKAHATLKILIASDIATLDAVGELVQCGVNGFMDVHAEVEEWEWAIKSVLQGKVHYAQQVMKHLAGSLTVSERSQPAPSHLLSKREMEILRLVASEYSTNRIADKLFISGKTVESHRRNLFQKLGVKNSVGLTKVAVRLGVI